MEFWLLHGTENSRNSIPNHSAEKKNTRNSLIIEQKKNFQKIFSGTFRGREYSSEFRSVEQIYKQTFVIVFESISQKRKQLQIPFSEQK